MMVTTLTRKFSGCKMQGWPQLSLKSFQLKSQSPSPQCQQRWASGSVHYGSPFILQIEGKMFQLLLESSPSYSLLYLQL